MISTHGYVAAEPPLGAPDTGGQVVFVLELSKQLARLGFKVDVWTRRFEGQAEKEHVTDDVTILRAPCGGPDFIPKEQLYLRIPEWVENAHRMMLRQGLTYHFINSHYWDAGLAGQALSEVCGIPHLHTPHSLGLWKKRQMEAACPVSAPELEHRFNFNERIRHEIRLYRASDLVIATSPPQSDLIISDYGVLPPQILEASLPPTK